MLGILIRNVQGETVAAQGLIAMVSPSDASRYQ